MRKIIISLLFAVIGISSSFAQHELGPALSSQIFSRINYNPAGIGNNDKINIFNLTRMQWIGFNGSPTSSVLNIHYFAESIKSGIGGSFSYDKIGLGNQAINAKLAYAYNLDLSDKALLSFGLSAGIDQFSKTYSSDVYDNTNETYTDMSKTNPDFDFGLEYSLPRVLIGASVNHIGMMAGPMTYSPGQTYYGYVRGSIPVNQEWMVAPSVLYMNSSQTNVIDVNAVAFYKQNYWGGLNFRVGAAMGIILGFEYEWFRLGYSYEMSLGKTANISSNTHELMLSFVIPTKFEGSPVAAKGAKGKATKAKGGKKKK